MMEKKVFVNLVAHRLTKQQIEAIREQLGVEKILEAEEVIPEKLLKKLRQCPANEKKLIEIAHKLSDELVKYALRNNAIMFVHLPVGSPAFMWVFANTFPHNLIHAVFSHTRRTVIEIQQPDGSVIKKSTFRFEKFIVF